MIRVCVVGATSRIAQETARVFAAEGCELVLVARRAERLAIVADDLRVRGARRVETLLFEAREPTQHEAMAAKVQSLLGTIDAVLIAHGVLPDQRQCEEDPAIASDTFAINTVGVASVALSFARILERQRAGCLAVIASVAADRGRRANYVYGASKAAVCVLLQGLRARLAAAGVAVVTIKPGLVDTPMTGARGKHRLFASPERVGRRIHRAIRRGEAVVYVPWYWRWISLAVRFVPSRVIDRRPR